MTQRTNDPCTLIDSKYNFENHSLLTVIKRRQTEELRIEDTMMKSFLSQMHFNPSIRGRENKEVKRSYEIKMINKYKVHSMLLSRPLVRCRV